MGLGAGESEDMEFVSCNNDDLAEEEEKVFKEAEKLGEMEGVERETASEMAIDLD